MRLGFRVDAEEAGQPLGHQGGVQSMLEWEPIPKSVARQQAAITSAARTCSLLEEAFSFTQRRVQAVCREDHLNPGMPLRSQMAVSLRSRVSR